jgi:hypothetical protein
MHLLKNKDHLNAEIRSMAKTYINGIYLKLQVMKKMFEATEKMETTGPI